MLHNWCFKTTNPILSFKNLRFSIEIFTDSNRFDIDPNKYHEKVSGNNYLLTAEGLTSAGGQLFHRGFVEVKITSVDKKYNVSISVQFKEKIRRVKLALFDEPYGELIARRRYVVNYDEVGKILRYPNGWDDLFTPLVVLKDNDSYKYYRSLDDVVRPKTFVFFKKEDKSNVELIFEQDARFLSKSITVPTWEIGTVSRYEDIYQKHVEHIAKAYGFERWEERKDIPSWARDISLVVNLHGMHWSGHIFSDYKEMTNKLEKLAQYVNPHHTLIYIPGFDGRYYYKYPDYTPSKRMGGISGFRTFVNKAHKLGYYVMPMFMINGANPKTKGFSSWGANSRYHSSNGFVTGVTSCDWDTSRGYDSGCGVGMNPGSKLWQKRFTDEVAKLLKEVEFDGIFLDLAAIYINDPYYSTHVGVTQIIDKLHKIKKDLLVATEGWYDALTPYFPLSQCAGEEKKRGEMIYHDTPYAPLFDTYNRAFGHLCLGDLIDGSNGVFEWGNNPSEHVLPLRKGLIQTLTIVNEVPDLDNKEFEQLLSNVKEYENRFLKGGK